MVAAPCQGGDQEGDSSLGGRGHRWWQLPAREGTGKVTAPWGEGDTDGGSSLPGRGPGR